jgi:TolB-like protein
MSDTSTSNVDFVVRAYDAKSGTLIWDDRHDVGSSDSAFAIAAARSRVFAVGRVTNSDGSNIDFIVRAYDAKNETFLWEDRLDMGSDDEASAITVRGNRVFAAGWVSNAEGDNRDFVVRAYNAQDGRLLWADRYDSGIEDGAFSITALGQQVFAAGWASNVDRQNPNLDFVVRAYEARSGTLRWKDRYNLGKNDEAYSITAKGG